jgi:DNA-binding beta-propeller fold protein YncE
VIPRKQTTVRGGCRSEDTVKRCLVLLPIGLAVGGLAACTASAEEVRPPEDQLFFPTGAALAPDESKLFVTNANSELRYDSGSISVVDLAVVDQVSADWTVAGTAPAGCTQDPDHTETLVCDEAQFIVPHSGARVGNFATSVSVQDLGGGNLRLVVPTRGDPSIAWVDWDGSRLSCNTSTTGFALCDEAHRLSYIHNDPDLALLPDEPFDVYAGTVRDTLGNPVDGYAVVTHLTSGAVTLIESPIGGDATIADVVTGLFAADPLTGLRGATGVSARPSASGDLIYVGSRSEDRIQTFTVGHPINGADPFLIPDNFFFLDAVGGNAGSSSDTRGMAFSPTGDRLYLINRRPPSLQVFDTSLKPTGFPANLGIAATDICRQASTLAVLDAGDGERVYVTCFQDGQLYIVDPRGQATVEDILTVGRGPYAVVASATRKKVYVTNFLEDTIAVIDVAPGSPTRNRVVLRIGEVKPP